MIAKNEAGNIARCINSMKDVADEVVVVDTGSTDSTVEIARGLGAKVIEEAWRDDFSHHRNTSLENTASDWIIFLDCDEELDPASINQLREAIQDPRYEAYYVQVVNLLENQAKMTAQSIRLFRNRECFRFVGRIHEQIVYSIAEHYGAASIGRIDVKLIHHGYQITAANIPAKIQRNLKILQSYPKDEQDGFYYYNLGTEYLRAGEKAKALANYLEALKLTRPNMGFGPILVHKTITTLIELQRYRDAIEQLSYYQTIYPDYSDLFYLEGFCHLRCGRYSKAREHLEHYFKMPPPPPHYPSETIYSGTAVESFLSQVSSLCLEPAGPDISVCVIARNESASIKQCLLSLNEIAREVILVDTGSSDSTPAIAHQLGAKLYKHPWTHSFAEARNFALEQAAGEWILVIDADEVLPDPSRGLVAKLVRNTEFQGYYFKVCSFLGRDLSVSNCEVTASCRLFRNNRYRYRGAVLEDITPAILESGGRLAGVDVQINHLHHLADSQHLADKGEWKRLAIERGMEPGSPKQSLALGMESFYRQDHASAANHFETVYHAPPGSLDPTRHAIFYYHHALCLINIKDPRRAIEVLDEGINRFPDYTNLVYLSSIAHFSIGKTGEAEQLLKRCLEMGDPPWEKYLVSPGIGSFKTLCSLGTVYAQRGQVEQALTILREAATSPGGFNPAVDAMVKVYLIKQLPVPLLSFLEENGVLNLHGLIAASQTLAGWGRYEESLEFLSLAVNHLAEEPAPRPFPLLTQSIERLLGLFQARWGNLTG